MNEQLLELIIDDAKILHQEGGLLCEDILESESRAAEKNERRAKRAELKEKKILTELSGACDRFLADLADEYC